MSSESSGENPYKFSESGRKGIAFSGNGLLQEAANAELEACKSRLKALAEKQTFTAKEIGIMLHGAGINLKSALSALELRWDELVAMKDEGQIITRSFENPKNQNFAHNIAGFLHDTASSDFGTSIDALLAHKETVFSYMRDNIFTGSELAGMAHNSGAGFPKTMESFAQERHAVMAFLRPFHQHASHFGPRCLARAMHNAGPEFSKKLRVLEENLNKITALATTKDRAWNLADRMHEESPSQTHSIINYIAEHANLLDGPRDSAHGNPSGAHQSFPRRRT